MRSHRPSTRNGAASAAPRLFRPKHGFTLPEIIFAVVILAIMTRVAMMKLVTPATLTLPAQAKSAAEQVRRAQTLASMRKQRMYVTFTTGANGTVTINCDTSASAPACPADGSFVYRTDQGVVVGSPSAAIYFNSLGQPVSASGVPASSDITFTMAFNGATHTVRVAALTGRVTVSP